MNAPKLRFKEFNDEWKKAQISSFVNINPKNDSLPEKFVYIDLESVNNGLLTSRKVINKSEAPSRAQRTIVKNDILYQTVRPYQMNNLFINRLDSDYPYIASTGYALLRTEENPYFVYSILYQKAFVNKVLNMCTGTSYLAISANDLGTIFVCLPSIREQEKISRTLELLDKKIELQSKKIEDLKLFKLELKERLFKIFETKQIELKDIIIKWNKKNKDNKYSYVESVSNKYGFIAQNEQFEDRNVASNDTKNYYVIEKGVFAYNPSRLNVGSLALKGNNKVSLVSPLYECFITNQNNKFLYEWFNSKEFKKGTVSKFEGGVRNTLNFSNLCKIKISLPSLENQGKISNILNLYNNLIRLESQKLNKLIELKKGLMQNMFV